MEKTRDFVATVYIVKDDKVLLVFHKKLQKWLPPGGHINEGELPEEAVVREAKEETGLDIELIGEKQPKISDIVEPLFRPEFIQLEDIEKTGKELHQHIDLFYLAKPKTHETKMSNESLQLRWFTIEEMEKENIQTDIVYNAKQMIDKMNNLSLENK